MWSCMLTGGDGGEGGEEEALPCVLRGLGSQGGTPSPHKFLCFSPLSKKCRRLCILRRLVLVLVAVFEIEVPWKVPLQ